MDGGLLEGQLVGHKGKYKLLNVDAQLRYGRKQARLTHRKKTGSKDVEGK